MFDGGRLGNLLKLLDCKNASVRRQASRNLGLIQDSHPEEFGNLLYHLLPFLQKPTWETRVAAASSVSAVLEKVTQKPNCLVAPISISITNWNSSRNLLRNFHVERTLVECDLRMGYLPRNDSNGVSSAGSEKEQRNRIDQKLGLHPQLGLDSHEWYSDDDLLHCNLQSSATSELVRSREKPEYDRGIYVEQLRDVSQQSCSDILQKFIQILLLDLSSYTWEARHGAALALKQCIIRVGNCLVSDTLDVICGELLEALALDRFNDFVEAQAVAPVRETCAQVLALTSACMSSESFRTLEKKLSQFFGPSCPWECKQSALLTLKYVLPLSNDTKCSEILSAFKTEILSCLEDSNDEVAGAASQSLLPVANVVGNDCDVETLLISTWKLLERWTQTDESSVAGLLQLLNLWMEAEVRFVPNNDQLMLLLKLLDHSTLKIRELAFRSVSCIMKRLSVTAAELKWSDVSVQMIFRVLYRRILLEATSYSDINSSLNFAVAAAWPEFLKCIGPEKIVTLICPYLGVWMACLMVPDANPYLNTFVSLDVESGTPESSEIQEEHSEQQKRDFIGGQEVMAFGDRTRLEVVTGNKLLAAKVLGATFSVVAGLNDPSLFGGESPSESLRLLLQLHLNSTSASQRSAVAIALLEWAKHSAAHKPHQELLDTLKLALTHPPVCYDETLVRLAELNSACTEFLQTLASYHVQIQLPDMQARISPESALTYCRSVYDSAKACLPTHSLETLEEHWKSLSSQVSNTTAEIQSVSRKLNCWLACALLGWDSLPDKFNPIVKPLMDSVKLEENRFLADLAAEGLTMLIGQAATRKPCPNAKIVKNLVSFHCSAAGSTFGDSEVSGQIVSLSRISAGIESGRKMTKNPPIEQDSSTEALMGENAGRVLRAVTLKFGAKLETGLPDLWSIISDLQPTAPKQELVRQLQVLETVIPVLTPILHQDLFERNSSCLWISLGSEYPSVRYRSCLCLTAFAQFLLIPVVNRLLPDCLGKVNVLEEENYRSGIVEFFHSLTVTLNEKLVGLLCLISPSVLGRMSDHSENIGSLASLTFSHLVTLLPLESNWKTINGLSPQLELILKKNRNFLTLLTNPGSLQMLELPLAIKEVTLRPYQREGVTWMWFLNQYYLHGILCDDMGLGKTIQTLCVMAMSHVTKQPKFPSLIVCPRTLIGHWVREIERFFDPKETRLKPVAITSGFKSALEWSTVSSDFTVLVTSYDTVRRSSGAFSDKLWHYCVLDEGHVVRNAKTQLFASIAALKAEHRLILSGTPVQNSVLELWTLFQFLMPGYLGTQQSFNAKYVKPVLQSRDAKLTSDQDGSPGERALESLHKQVLPFVLRRQKADVLQDLPPKIIQDYYCQLSPLQARLYENFGNRVAESEKNINALMILTYLRKLCDHPCLVLSEDHPEFAEIQKDLMEQQTSFTDIELSGKMAALSELLRECGIGESEEADVSSPGAHQDMNIICQHRALIFCQFKSTVDLIANYLKSGDLCSKEVSWLKLDGSVAPKDRQAVADRFNADTSVDILLLTTQVGGLGLNLVGADVVIFVDHDWNPVKDLQAMDRAHRLGQRRTVNVYRLISQGTLEEKIMRVQKFKTHTAEVLIGDDNRSLLSMATDQLLDLLTLERTGGSGSEENPQRKRRNRSTGLSSAKKIKVDASANKEIRLEVSELWDRSQYDEAFDMGEFLSLFH